MVWCSAWKEEVIPIKKIQIDTVELERRLAEYIQTDEFSFDMGILAGDYEFQGLQVPPREKLREEAISEARKSLETIMICEAKGHRWHEEADPENGMSKLTCRRCGKTGSVRWL